MANFRKSFQSRSTPSRLIKGRFNLGFDEDSEANRDSRPISEEYRKRICNQLLSQLSLSDNELMDKWPSNGLALNRISGRRILDRKFSIEEEYEETNLVLVNVKNLQKRDFYAENRARLDLENFLPDLVIQWQDAKDKSYKEILSELAQQMLANDFEETDFTKIKSNFFIENLGKYEDDRLRF